METAVFGGGCFWCTEAVYQRLRGVERVESGYAGGLTDRPTYEDVSGGETGHAEVIRISFDPAQVSYETLLDVFFSFHDPTTLNRQGHDVGPQYRSAIYYTSPAQADQAAAYIRKLAADGVFSQAIVTEVRPLEKFFSAEDYHQNFYNNNRNYPYCTAVIDPKIAKLRQKFSRLLRDE